MGNRMKVQNCTATDGRAMWDRSLNSCIMSNDDCDCDVDFGCGDDDVSNSDSFIGVMSSKDS